MIKKALKETIDQLIGLNPNLWLQVGGMSVSMSLGVTVFSTYRSGGTTLELALLLLTELFIVLFSISTFSIYLAKAATKRSEKLGLRKTLDTSNWDLFLETSAQTTLLVTISIICSIGVIDVTMLIAGLNFEIVLQNIGALHYGALLLAVFILSEGMLFIVQGVALAPSARSEFAATTLYEKNWFVRLARILSNLSMFFGLFTLISFCFLFLTSTVYIGAIILEIFFFLLLILWWVINRKKTEAYQ